MIKELKEARQMKHKLFIAALTAVLTLVLSVAYAFAQEQGRLIKSPDDLSHMGVLVGKTVCIVISKDDQAKTSLTETCATIREVGRRSNTEFGIHGELRLKVEMEYDAVPTGRIVEIAYVDYHKAWWAIVQTNTTGHPLNRGVTVDEFRVF